ncbi:MAG: integrase [Methylohalobius sp. ZOD2]
MATIRKRGQRWQAQVRRQGLPPVSKSFPTKREAQDWASQVEGAIVSGEFRDYRKAERTTFAEASKLYRENVLPGLKGGKQDASRLSIVNSFFSGYALAAIDTQLLHTYRDKRLLVVGPQTVKHELTLVRRVLKWCQLEAGIALPQGIPDMKAPKLPRGRERRVGDRELARVCKELDFEKAAMVRFAVEAAMRRGELCVMRWEDVGLPRRMLRIPETKNGHSRVIPLSSRAVKILESLPRRIDGQVWGGSPSGISHAFLQACRRAGVEGLRFHDLRHEATSRLFERGLELMEVAAITGHRSLSMLQRYTHLKPSGLLEKIG